MDFSNQAVATYYYGTQQKITAWSNVNETGFVSPVSSFILGRLSSDNLGLLIYNNSSIDILDMYVIFNNGSIFDDVEVKYIDIISSNESVTAYSDENSYSDILVIYTLIINNQRNIIYRIV